MSLQRPPRGCPGKGPTRVSTHAQRACILNAPPSEAAALKYAGRCPPPGVLVPRVPPGFRHPHSACKIYSRPPCRSQPRNPLLTGPVPAQHQTFDFYIPCFCITCRYLTMTLEQGRMRTWRLPAFSALLRVFNASASTLMRTMVARDLRWVVTSATTPQPQANQAHIHSEASKPMRSRINAYA